MDTNSNSDNNNSRDLHNSSRSFILRGLNSHRTIDVVFGVFCLIMIIYYFEFISSIDVPIWDGAGALNSANEWIRNASLSEPQRAPLFSWIIDSIWIFTGENWMAIKYLQMSFTIAGIVLLYVVLRQRKGPLFAFGVSLLTFSNANLFFYTSQIRSEGLSFFLVILSLFLLESGKRKNWLFTGISIGLTFAARYPVLLQSLIIFLIESIMKKDPKFSLRVIIVAISLIVIIVSIVYAKTGTFEMGTQSNTYSSSHILNAFSIWGPIIALLPIAFLFKSTYKDKFNYVFISWFIISLVASSWSVTSHQYWLLIEFMPAAYFLVILAIENLVRFDRNNLIFTRSKAPEADRGTG